MNGVDIKIWNYYIEEQEMVKDLLYFIINVIIKGQLYAYVKIKREIYLEDILPFHGLHQRVIKLQMDVFYLL